MADIVPAAIGRLDAGLRARLAIVQQARDEDLSRVRHDLCEPRGRRRNRAVLLRSAGAHGGEPSRDLALRRLDRRRTRRDRPAVDPGAAAARARSGPIRQCRRARTRRRRAAGCAQDDFTPQRLATEIAALAGKPQRLAAMAAAARSVGRLDAADRLADLVLKVAGMAASSNCSIIHRIWPGLSRPFDVFH